MGSTDSVFAMSQVAALRQLRNAQTASYLVVGSMLAVVLLPESWQPVWIIEATAWIKARVLVLLFGCLIMLVTYFGGIVTRELYDVSDQVRQRR